MISSLMKHILLSIVVTNSFINMLMWKHFLPHAFNERDDSITDVDGPDLEM